MRESVQRSTRRRGCTRCDAVRRRHDRTWRARPARRAPRRRGRWCHPDRARRNHHGKRRDSGERQASLHDRDHWLIGPNAHITGATLEDEVFVATGAAIFHGAVVGRGSEVRVHATVHLRTRLEPGAMVPIGWVAVGDPARILPPDRHDEIWEVQKPLNFPQWVYGFDRSTPDLMRHVTRRLSEALEAHAGDTVIDG